MRNLTISDPAFLALTRRIVNASTPADTTVSDWVARVISNGGSSPSAPTIAAANTFWNTLVSSGISAKMKCVNFFAPDSFTAAATPLVVGGGYNKWLNWGYDADTDDYENNIGFNNGSVSVNGVQGDSNSWFETNVIANNIMTPTDNGVVVYVSANPDDSYGSWDIGASDSSNLRFSQNGGDGSIHWTMYGNDDLVQGDAFTLGYAACFRIGDVISQYNRDATNAHHLAASASNPDNSNLNVPHTAGFSIFGTNEGGNTVGIQDKTLSFVAMTRGLTEAESSTLASAIQTLRTAFGGGYV